MILTRSKMELFDELPRFDGIGGIDWGGGKGPRFDSRGISDSLDNDYTEFLQWIQKG